MWMTVLLLVLLLGSRSPAAQAPPIDLYRASMSFCCKPVDGYHDLELFKDSGNNRIGDACIRGATIADLRALGVRDLAARLDTLRGGNVIRWSSGRCFLTFPVLTGRRRDALAAAVRPVAEALAQPVVALRDSIVRAVPGHEEMVFHLLWSRVMDQVFCRAWQRERRPGECPPGADWVVSPASPYTFGTNSWGNDFAITWNPRTRCAVTPVVTAARIGLLDAARGRPYTGPQAGALRQLGLIDTTGRFLGFAYESDGALDRLLDRLTSAYATLVAGRYAYDRLAGSLGLREDQLWVILLHETAYAVFADLDRAGTLDLPPAFSGADDLVDCRETMSLLLHP